MADGETGSVLDRVAAPPTLAVVDGDRRLARVRLTGRGPTAALAEVCSIAADAVPGAREASITVYHHEQPRHVAFTGDLAARLDERQFPRGFSPGPAAAAATAVVTIDDTSHPAAHPDFADRVAAAGIRSVLVVGLPRWDEQDAAALTLYGSRPLTDDGVRAAVVEFGVGAGTVVGNAAALAAAREGQRQLQEALVSRAVIDQAKGIVMSRRGCTADEAFTLLRRVSNDANVKVRDLAHDLIAETVGRVRTESPAGPGRKRS